jgi:hypothetical protein
MYSPLCLLLLEVAKLLMSYVADWDVEDKNMNERQSDLFLFPFFFD